LEKCNEDAHSFKAYHLHQTKNSTTHDTCILYKTTIYSFKREIIEYFKNSEILKILDKNNLTEYSEFNEKIFKNLSQFFDIKTQFQKYENQLEELMYSETTDTQFFGLEIYLTFTCLYKKDQQFTSVLMKRTHNHNKRTDKQKNITSCNSCLNIFLQNFATNESLRYLRIPNSITADLIDIPSTETETMSIHKQKAIQKMTHQKNVNLDNLEDPST